MTSFDKVYHLTPRLQAEARRLVSVMGDDEQRSRYVLLRRAGDRFVGCWVEMVEAAMSNLLLRSGSMAYRDAKGKKSEKQACILRFDPRLPGWLLGGIGGSGHVESTSEKRFGGVSRCKRREEPKVRAYGVLGGR